MAELDLNRVLEIDTLVFNRVANNRDLDAIKSLPAYTKLVEEYKQKQVLTPS